MARAWCGMLTVIVLLGVSVRLAAAGMQLCDSSKAPGQPWNALLTSNDYDAGSKISKLTMTWRSPVKSASDGCLDGYRIEIWDGSNKLGSDSMNASPVTDPLKFTTSATPGKLVTLKIVAVNKANGKESGAATVATVTAQTPPVTSPQGPQKPQGSKPPTSRPTPLRTRV